MNDEQSVAVIDMAKEFIGFIRQIEPSWSKAYFRFCLDESRYGSNGSYVSGPKVTLIDPFKHHEFFTGMNEKARQFLTLLEKRQSVLLLV